MEPDQISDDENTNLRETLEAAADAIEARTETDPTAEGAAELTIPATEAPAAEAPAAEAPAAEAPAAEIPTAPAPENEPGGRPPGSWTPAAREKWKETPSEVREEIWKREREASRALTISTEARKFQSEFSQTMQPYLGFIAAEGSTPMQAVGYMMQTAAALRVGTGAQKAALVADIIKNYKVSIEDLDSILAGQQPAANPQGQLQELVRQEMRPVMEFVQQNRQFAQQQEQRMESEVQTELQQFANDPKNEFYWDVKDTMADLMEISTRRGEVLGLTAAYERATLMHEPVRRVIDARKQRDSVKSSTQLARRARGSAASVTPSAEIDGAKQTIGDSLRASIEAAIDVQQGR